MRLTELRTSFVFGRTVLGPLAGDAADVPRPYVLDRHRYADRYAERGAGGPTPPWPVHGYQGFWERYLGAESSLHDVGASRAFANLVPLRFALEAPTADDPALRVLAEAFAYPWGVALVLTLTLPSGWATVEQAGEAVVRLRRTTFANAGTARLSIDKLAVALLDDVCLDTFGEHAGERWSEEPFSVSTILKGSGTLADFLPTARPVHQLLHALASFDPAFGTVRLPALGASRVAGRRAPPEGHEVYGTRRGRAIWGPQHFLRGARVRTLGCQHRNLVLASAQAEALAALMIAARREFDDGRRLQSSLHARTKAAALALGRFRDGVNTYRSGSIRAQIDANDWVEPTNAVLHELGMAPLG